MKTAMRDARKHNRSDSPWDDPRWVVKVGGSLFDLDDLGRRLQVFLQRYTPPQTALVIGGGLTADVVRDFDQRFHLGDVPSHWLALRALTLNSHLLASLVPGCVVVSDLSACQECWATNHTPILDPFAFLTQDEGQPNALPHCWDVTSDSVAARLAELIGADTLVLLKSTSPPHGATPNDWAATGLVDSWFPRAIRRLQSVRVINFRTWSDEQAEA
ncbi:MAG: hypothetical protein NZM31_13730 [Gemmatales bacterium]|nr:hypothetical protein [Gemmatales bacterium]MDW8388056.1 hypothetical protein [Gemmatales bacterium]